MEWSGAEQVVDAELIKAITRLQVQMENVEKVCQELRLEIRPPKNAAIPVTGGVVGALAMLWTAYLQVSGNG